MATHFVISLGEVLLDVGDIWPDGNAPENPTPEDVVEQMRSSGGSTTMVASDWNLLDEIEVIASNGARAVFR